MIEEFCSKLCLILFYIPVPMSPFADGIVILTIDGTFVPYLKCEIILYMHAQNLGNPLILVSSQITTDWSSYLDF